MPALARSFLHAAAQAYQRSSLQITPEGLDWLPRQPWPGNVRELKQVIERTVLIGTG